MVSNHQGVVSELVHVCAAFFEHREQGDLIARILDAAIRLTSADRGTVFLAPLSTLENDALKLKSLVATGLDGKGITVDITQGVVGHVFRTREPMRIDDAQNHPLFYSKIDELTRYKTLTILTVPLRTPQGRTIGAIEILNSKKGKFSEEDQETLQVLGLFAAIALEQQTAMRLAREGDPSVVSVRLLSLDVREGKVAVERELIRRAMEQSRGNKSEAARILGMTREGLRKAMVRFGGSV